jgi:hypothetical protein
MGLAVSLVAFLRSEDYRTLPRDKRVRSSADNFAEVSRGGWVETAYHSPKFLIGLQVPDIIERQVGANLSGRLHRCSLQGVG